MSQAISDFMIHVDNSMAGVDMASIADSLCNNTCVAGACVSESAPHLIMVSYDSECTRANNLLEMVKQSGIQAEVVGW
jgi:hypothetical protein